MAKNDVAELKALAAQAEVKYRIPTGVLSGLIEQESSWNPSAVSRVGAAGLTQIMPFNFKAYGLPEGSAGSDALKNNPALSIDVGARFLANGIRDNKGSVPLALAAYNGGQSRVNKWMAGTDELRAETRDYVPKIMARSMKYGGEKLSNGDMSALIAQFKPTQSQEKILKSAGVLGKISSETVQSAAYSAAGQIPPAIKAPTIQEFAANPLVFDEPAKAVQAPEFPDPFKQVQSAFNVQLPQQEFAEPAMPVLSEGQQMADMYSLIPEPVKIVEQPKFDLNGLRDQVNQAYKAETPHDISEPMDKYLSSLFA